MHAQTSATDEADLHSVGSDTKSVSSSPGQHRRDASGSPSLDSQSLAGPTSNSSTAVAEIVLGLTDEFLGLIKKLYTIADNKYAEELLEVPSTEIFEGADCLDGAQSLADVAAAKKKLKTHQNRLKIAKSQAVLAENRLKLANAQVAVIEDQVNAQIDELEDVLNAARRLGPNVH